MGAAGNGYQMSAFKQLLAVFGHVRLLVTITITTHFKKITQPFVGGGGGGHCAKRNENMKPGPASRCRSVSGI